VPERCKGEIGGSILLQDVLLMPLMSFTESKESVVDLIVDKHGNTVKIPMVSDLGKVESPFFEA